MNVSSSLKEENQKFVNVVEYKKKINIFRSKNNFRGGRNGKE